MTMKTLRKVTAVIVCLSLFLCSAVSLSAADSKATQQQLDFFEKKIRPVLIQHCYECHSADSKNLKGSLLVDSRKGLLDGGDSGTALVPGKPGESLLLETMKYGEDSYQMPPKGKLSDEIIADFEKWIEMGAADPRTESSKKTAKAEIDFDKAREFWSFQVPRHYPAPEVKQKAWPQNRIDAFILAAQEAKGFTPAPRASKQTLIRRAYFDLIGLPPTPAEVDAFLKDESPDAYARLIDQLLQSPHYGERWGRHWLDLARWAESNGHQHNRLRPHAWRYRDYVIRSFMEDKPFDQFLKEQLAGDLLLWSEDHIVATGFLAAARYSGNELDKQIQRNDILVDVVNTTSTVFLGLTMECAQCHSHKFDPISIRDYYQFQAFFSDGQPGDVILAESRDSLSQYVQWRWQIFDATHAGLVAEQRAKGVADPILITPENVEKQIAGKAREIFTKLERSIADAPRTWGWYSASVEASAAAVAPHDMRWPLPRTDGQLRSGRSVLRPRGDIKAPGPEVMAAWPAVLCSTDGASPMSDDVIPDRIQLADWMTSRNHPLTARVWVNRIWQWHFGTGLVETSGDFGTQGARPTHPELLDWLAAELMDSGWKTSHIHRLILNSSTWQQSSAYSEANAVVDPENHLYWRWQPRRLEAEAVRDLMLACGDRLEVADPGGPSAPDGSAGDRPLRRSLYLIQKRDELPRHQQLFDGPDSLTSCTRRRTSTVPLQPLFLMNSPFSQTTVAALAKRIREDAAETDEQIRRLVQLTLEREVSPEERKQFRAFVEENSIDDLCLVMLNCNEFVYMP
ncbi:MAG: PSD1 domain-containing protein [Planctomycetaceae bacterium]|nr:PSD1 domain-containing protein [Planctomycetaceae bacterium]